jgi:hypothetical protein
MWITVTAYALSGALLLTPRLISVRNLPASPAAATRQELRPRDATGQAEG